MIKPGFQIAKNKVKVVGAIYNNGNMGLSTNSLTNLASGSDLGKYMPLSGLPSPKKLNTLANTFDSK